jgi:antitoxin ParD1/3/4
MPTMNISLPENMKEFVDAQVESGSYSSASEFVRELVRREQKNREREQLELKMLEGLSSGAAQEVTPEMWDQLRLRLRAQNSMKESV